MTFEEYAIQRIADIRSGKVVVDNIPEAIAILEANLKLVSSPTPPLLALDGDLLLAYSSIQGPWYVSFTPKTGDLFPTLEINLPYQQASTLFNDIAARVRENSVK